MTDVFDEIIEGVETLIKTTDAVVLDAVQKNERAIISLNIDDQLFKQGIDANGRELSPPYTPFTVSIKKMKGQPFNRVTLRDTGDFHDSFDLIFDNDKFAIDGTDRKTAKLEAKYGSEIFGLTPANVDRMIDIIRDDFIDEAQKVIFQ